MPLTRIPSSASAIDVLDHVLDKGIVIDAWVQVALVGINLLTVDARVVVASIRTYLNYGGAVAEHLRASLPRRTTLTTDAETIESWSRTVAELLERYERRTGERSAPQQEHRRAEDRIFEELRDARAQIVEPRKSRRSRATRSN
jgi:gas vesicle structural protein